MRSFLRPFLLVTLLFLLHACALSNPFPPVINTITPGSGAPGTRITLDGNHFTINPGRALLAGVPAEIVSWTNTRIVAVVPTGTSGGTWTIDNGTYSNASGPSFATGVQPTAAPTVTPTASASASPSASASASPSASPTASASPSASPSAAAAVVTTFAGSGTSGFADGSGAAAQFSSPLGLVIDGTGNLLVGDSGNNRIRQATAAGVVSTVAGTGVAGSTEGAGTAAQFNFPAGVALEPSGTLVIADRNNNKIRRISAGPIVSTVAPSGTFSLPSDVAVDAAGNIYVADSGANRVAKINTSNVVTTLAGGASGTADGTGTSAQFNGLFALVLDPAGTTLFVADTLNHRIRAITIATGAVTTLAGSTQGTADGSGTAAQFAFPTGITVDGSGNLYVADTSNHRIRKVTAAGVVTTIAGSGTAGFADGTGAAAQFNNPAGIDFSSGSLFVIDSLNHRIRKLTGF